MNQAKSPPDPSDNKPVTKPIVNTNAKSNPTSSLVITYVLVIVFFTFVIGVFSLIMMQIVMFRNDIMDDTYTDVTRIYNGPLEQSAPNLDMLEMSSIVYKENKLTPDLVRYYIDNTFLTSTDAKVEINAEFVKKGLVYQPTYKTKFYAKYNLQNTLDKESFVKFVFPFPTNINNGEISNAKLIINGIEIKDSKVNNLTVSGSSIQDSYYPSTSQGLKWEGKLPPNSDNLVEVSYDTVGLSYFSYNGIENSKKSQDLRFELKIAGTRSYDVTGGLSVDKREFGENFVVLTWDKKNLYSKPYLEVSVGEKLNPSVQVSRVYFTMAPIYAVFMAILCFLAYKFARPLRVFDVFLLTVLFVIYFPFIHYISSFTIDPTMEVFSSFKDVGEFSMPLYAAFGIAWIVIVGLMYYFLGRITNFKFSTKLGIPAFILFLGFFPLVVTIPEYSILLVLVGVIALTAIIVQTRIRLLKQTEKSYSAK